MPALRKLKISYPINQNYEHFGAKHFTCSIKTVNTLWDFSPKFIPSTFWEEMGQGITKATATILCHMMLFQLNHTISGNCFSLVTISFSYVEE